MARKSFHDRDFTRITNVNQCSEKITRVNSIAQRLKEAREAAGMTQPELAARAKVSQGTIGNIESGLRKRPRELLNIAAALSVDPAWLESGKGSSSSSNVEVAVGSRGKVPLISWISAGKWSSATTSMVAYEAERWLDCPASHSPSSYALRVRGDSMTSPHGHTRTYPEGCLIFVDPERTAPVNGERVIARLQGTDEVTFKVFKSEDGRQWLQPLNPAHEPIREPFTVLGTVLGKWEDG